MSDSHRLKSVPAVVGAGILLVGCSAPEEERSAEDDWCGEQWCTFGAVDGAYQVGLHASLFCYAEEARGLVEDGEVDLDELIEDLPQWAVATDDAGDPVIIEVATTPPNQGRERANQVDDALANQGVELDRGETSECMDSVSQEVIEASEGPYRGPSVHPGGD